MGDNVVVMEEEPPVVETLDDGNGNRMENVTPTQQSTEPVSREDSNNHHLEVKDVGQQLQQHRPTRKSILSAFLAGGVGGGGCESHGILKKCSGSNSTTPIVVPPVLGGTNLVSSRLSHSPNFGISLRWILSGKLLEYANFGRKTIQGHLKRCIYSPFSCIMLDDKKSRASFESDQSAENYTSLEMVIRACVTNLKQKAHGILSNESRISSNLSFAECLEGRFNAIKERRTKVASNTKEKDQQSFLSQQSGIDPNHCYFAAQADYAISCTRKISYSYFISSLESFFSEILNSPDEEDVYLHHELFTSPFLAGTTGVPKDLSPSSLQNRYRSIGKFLFIFDSNLWSTVASEPASETNNNNNRGGEANVSRFLALYGEVSTSSAALKQNGVRASRLHSPNSTGDNFCFVSRMCLWEMYWAIQELGEQSILVALPDQSKFQLTQDLLKSPKSVTGRINSAIDFEQTSKIGEIRSPDDEAVLRALKAHPTRITAIEKQVFRALSLWCLNLGTKHLDAAVPHLPSTKEGNLLKGRWYYGLANLSKELEESSISELLWRKALESFKLDDSTDSVNASASCAHNLAEILRVAGDFENALPLYRLALEIWIVSNGEYHSTVGTGYNNLAYCLKGSNRAEEAIEIYNKAVNVWKHQSRATGQNNNLQLSVTLGNLASLLTSLGRLEEAIASYKEVIICRKRVYGPNHEKVISSLQKITSLYYTIGKLEEAEVSRVETLSLCKSHYGEDAGPYRNFEKEWNRIKATNFEKLSELDVSSNLSSPSTCCEGSSSFPTAIDSSSLCNA